MWQPIHTIPTVPHTESPPSVLVYVPGGDEREGVFEAVAYPDGRYYDPVYSEWSGEGATHWMPLPAPPEAVQP